jgi:ABC-type phosphate transport system permease subunit
MWVGSFGAANQITRWCELKTTNIRANRESYTHMPTWISLRVGYLLILCFIVIFLIISFCGIPILRQTHIVSYVALERWNLYHLYPSPQNNQMNSNP